MGIFSDWLLNDVRDKATLNSHTLRIHSINNNNISNVVTYNQQYGTTDIQIAPSNINITKRNSTFNTSNLNHTLRKPTFLLFRRIGLLRNLPEHEYRLTKVLLLIVVAYVLCWTPATVVHYIEAGGERVPRIYLYFIVTLVELKSALNPLIYGVGNKRYRRALVKLRKQSSARFGFY